MTAAIVLAAGRGSRLRNYSRHLPKALVRAGGRALLDWQLDALAACGISPVVIAGGYRSESLRRPGVELVEVPDWQSHGPFASLRAARPERFSEDFLVAYADCPHHASNMQRLCEQAADVAVVGDRSWKDLWRMRHGDPLTDAETYRSERGLLREIGAPARSDDDVQAQFAGLLRFTPRGWGNAMRIADSASVAPFDMTSLLSALIGAGEPIADVPIRGRWCEIDSAEDLHLCRRRLHAEEPWSHDWRETKDARACR